MNVIKLRLRQSGLDQSGARLRPAPEEIDLDILTPRARALAEAFAANTLDTLAVAFEGPDGRVMNADRWASLSYDSPMTGPEWIEWQARTGFPLEWYPIRAARGSERVPSWQAGAADRMLVRETVLAYLREHGHPMDVTAWDTLRGTGHLPEPDRRVFGQPQWRPEAIDAYMNRDVELWSISRIAGYLGFTSASATGSARRQLSRWGFSAVGRAPGRGGESLYVSDQIIAAHTHRLGRGARTDLAPPP